MSCIFVVTPLVTVYGGWPAFCESAACAAASLGYKRLIRKTGKPADITAVAVPMNSSRIYSERQAREERMVMVKDGIQVEFGKDERDRFNLRVRGDGIDKEELHREGEKIIGRIRQQYAYRLVREEMEKQGYIVASENVDQDHRIKLRLERLG